MLADMGGTNITNVCENTTLQSAAIDQKNFDKIIGSITDIKLSVEQICRAMKKLDVVRMANYVVQDSCLRILTRDFGVQTGLTLAN